VTSAASDSYASSSLRSPEHLSAGGTFKILIILAVPAHIRLKRKFHAGNIPGVFCASSYDIPGKSSEI